MVTQIQLGNFFTVNGKNILGSSGGSGLDTKSIIDTLVQAKSAKATQDQDQIKINDGQTAALNQFQQLLSTFQSAADALRNPPGVGNAADNAFDFTTGTVSANGSGYVSITTTPGALLQSYTINNITQLATTATQTTGTFALASADTSAVSASPIIGTNYQFAPGTFTLNGQDITLNEGDSLNTVAAKFNAVKDNTGVAATVIQIGNNQYEIQFSATKTGAANSFDLSDPANVTDNSWVLGNIGLTKQQSTGTMTIADPSSTVVSAGALGIGSQFAPGTLTFAGSGATVTLNEGDSLATVASRFNAVTDQTGIEAHITEPTAGHFKLVFTATTGSGNFDLTNIATVSDPDGTLTGASLGAVSAGSAATAGQDAQFKINGISITRSSNSISDVISGVTFNLLQTTSNDPSSNANITATVQPDTTTIQNTIVSFVNAYNALKTFAAQQTQLNADGTYASTAVLAGNQSFRQTMSDIDRQVTSLVSGVTAGHLQSLADVGITLTKQPATGTTPEVDNILTVNDGQLSSALSSNFQQVKELFGVTLNSTNPALALFSETNGLGVSQFSLNIDPGTSTFTATYTPSDGVPTTVNLTATALAGGTGYLLKGPAGSALDGLQLIYASNSSAVINNITLTQGIADKSYNATSAATTLQTGTLALALKQLKDSDTQLNKDITQVNDMVAQYQQQLLNQFSALEQMVSNVNNLLSSLAANDQARYIAAQH